MISTDIYPKFNERNYTQWIVCRYPTYILLVLSFQFICTYILHIYILIKKKLNKMEKNQFLNIAPPCFLLQISLSYPKRTANILFHVLLICTHTQSFARFCSPWWVSCQSLNKRLLPVHASVATTLCILPSGTHVIDSTVHLRWAFRHNILVHFPWHTGKLSSRRET